VKLLPPKPPTQPIAEISGSSHSSKSAFGRLGKRFARDRASVNRALSVLTSLSPRPPAWTIAPSMRIMPRMPATQRAG